MTATSSQELPAARRAGLRERALPPRVVRLHVARVLEPPPPQVLRATFPAPGVQASRHMRIRPESVGRYVTPVPRAAGLGSRLDAHTHRGLPR
jgi:hypothetical protein